jgi:ATP-dependent DNA ligase
LEGHNVTSLPLEQRKQLLRDHFDFVPPVYLVEPLPETGIAAYDRACREGWEGVMAKRLGSTYESKRSRAWLKMKCLKGQEFVVGGWTEPSGTRVGFGALLIGYYDGDDFVFAGKLGTGFDTKLLNSLYAQMKAIEIPKAPFTAGSGVPRKDAHWVRPEIVVDAGFMEWTGEGHDAKLRHPKFIRVRDDKAPKDVVRETPS